MTNKELQEELKKYPDDLKVEDFEGVDIETVTQETDYLVL